MNETTHPDTHPTSQVFRELLYGKHAHANSLAAVDVAADHAGRQVPGLPHTVWQLVWHMNYWMAHELARIDGQPVAYPEHAAESWPAAQPLDAAAWDTERHRFGALLARLGELAGSTPSELGREIPPTNASEAAHASTLAAVLWQTLVHNSYHVGQVVQVRQALGLWPPERGADTW